MKQSMKDPLLAKAAALFAETRYLDGDFIVENNVSAADSFALWTRIAAIINGYLKAPQIVQYALLSSGADDEGKLTESLWMVAAEQMMLDHSHTLFQQLDKATATKK